MVAYCNRQADLGFLDFTNVFFIFLLTNFDDIDEEKWAWPWARGAPKNFGVPFNIFATAEASDFKFGTPFGFSKAHHKITPSGISGRGPGLGKLPKICGSPLIF